MLNGMMDSVKGCLKEEIKMDVVSNNLANANVIGFKKDRICFQDLLRQQFIEGTQEETSGSDPIDSTQISIKTDFGQGDMRGTRNTLDVAINGDGFFKINTPLGLLYTRKGNFRLDAQGLLVTQEGHPVSGRDGSLNISGHRVIIKEDGTIMVDGSEQGRLDVVDFENYENLQKVGKGLFRNNSDEPERQHPPETKIKQGYVEFSNVNVAAEMVQMIRSLRTFESYQKAIQVLDGINRKVINDVSNLR